MIQRLDQRSLDIDPSEILGFARVRNENLRLPWCLDFHRGLGVNRFFVVDNNSSDGSADYLLTRDDTHVFWTDASYAESRGGLDWINPLLRQFGTSHWTVTFDADELTIYPGFEHVGLHQLTRYLDREGATALSCMMIDMYSDGPIEKARYERGQDFLEVCPFFDSEPIEGMRGGARERLFWRGRDRDSRAPVLRKTPLVCWRSDLQFAVSTHTIAGIALARISGAILHFKMFHDFRTKVQAGVREKQYWDGSKQYTAYLAGIDDNPGLTALYDRSARLRDSTQLVELGLMSTTAEYETWLSSVRHEA